MDSLLLAQELTDTDSEASPVSDPAYILIRVTRNAFMKKDE
jgi:hypothetical protein